MKKKKNKNKKKEMEKKVAKKRLLKKMIKIAKTGSRYQEVIMHDPCKTCPTCKGCKEKKKVKEKAKKKWWKRAVKPLRIGKVNESRPGD